ncbi:MAG: hypothetical protein HY716_10795 [Planctomycetes bacterium]|nr:hypothetical protein [Planctomycetota bacterium]
MKSAAFSFAFLVLAGTSAWCQELPELPDLPDLPEEASAQAQEALDNALETAQAVLDGLDIPGAVADGIQNALDAIEAAQEQVTAGLEQAQEAVENAGETAAGAVENAQDAIETGQQVAQDVLNQLRDAVENALNNMP